MQQTVRTHKIILQKKTYLLAEQKVFNYKSEGGGTGRDDDGPCVIHIIIVNLKSKHRKTVKLKCI